MQQPLLVNGLTATASHIFYVQNTFIEDRVEIMEDHIPQRGLTTPRAYARDLGRIYVNSVSPRHARRSTCRNENNKSKSTSPFHPGYNSPVSCSTPESSKSSLKDVTNLLSLCGNIKSMTIVSPRESSSSQSSKENVLLDGITKRRRNESSAGPSLNTFESELDPSKKHETRQSTPIATFARPAERGWRESRKLKSRRRIDKHPYFVEKSKREEYKRVCARKYRETGPKAVTMFTSKGTQTPEVSDNEVLEWDYSFS
ncbi:hypothetical protein QYM36_001425 [Artemia franciscana]|uniref:Uncharacterized protein n=2 Tax=Artemia franciscana TaxID=6661 RepID=A0AA88IBF9_ARTSF|nr:hypothetical protein QYM36_001425 [Artemia franciscana]